MVRSYGCAAHQSLIGTPATFNIMPRARDHHYFVASCTNAHHKYILVHEMYLMLPLRPLITTPRSTTVRCFVCENLYSLVVGCLPRLESGATADDIAERRTLADQSPHAVSPAYVDRQGVQKLSDITLWYLNPKRADAEQEVSSRGYEWSFLQYVSRGFLS